VAADGAARLVGVTRQIVGAPWTAAAPFAYAGSIWPCDGDELDWELCQRLGECLAAEFSLVGLFGVDLIVNAQTVWPVELNPRYTASVELLERSTGVPAMTWHVSACRDGLLPTEKELAPVSHGPRRWAKAIVFARRRLVVGRQFVELARAWNEGQPWPPIADLPALGCVIEAGQPISTVFADRESAAAAETELRRRTWAIRRSLGDLP
jgi:predicted ATP-grasp superfamily ATP-dependent carboligase